MLRFLLFSLVGCLCYGASFATNTDTTTLARIDGRNGCAVELRSVPMESGPLLLVRGVQIRPSTGAVAFDVTLPISSIELDTLMATVKAARARSSAGMPRSHLSGHSTKVNHHIGFSLGAVTENEQLVWRPEITLKADGHLRIVALMPEQLAALEQAVAQARQQLAGN